VYALAIRTPKGADGLKDTAEPGCNDDLSGLKGNPSGPALRHGDGTSRGLATGPLGLDRYGRAGDWRLVSWSTAGRSLEVSCSPRSSAG
jgi:hypothetical protein